LAKARKAALPGLPVTVAEIGRAVVMLADSKNKLLFSNH
jgi:hypothetical protein